MKDNLREKIISVIDWKNLKGLSGLVVFALIITFFHLLYKYFEPDIISIPIVSEIIEFLTNNLLITNSWIMEHLFSIRCVSEGDVLELPNGFKIEMQFGCSGLQQFFLVIILFLIYPGSWKAKTWYIPVSIVVIHVLNLIRLIGISLYSANDGGHFDFIHNWIFRPFIYLGIFLLWVAWVEVINKKNQGKRIS